MRKISQLSLTLAFLLATPASAQSLVESATAAAGGSAAGVAGKKVSEGIDSVFSKVAAAAKSAAAEDGRRGSRIAPAVPPIPEVRLRVKEGGEPGGAKLKTPSGAVQPTSNQARLQPGALSGEAAVSASAPPTSVAAPPPPTGPTLEDLQSLSAGASRQQVFDKLGRPASSISMSNDDGFVEVMKFRNQDGSMGSVRVVNGKVTEVKAQ